MGRKAVKDSKKREDIINAAWELFFTKGFDGTSVRTIMRSAGGEVGLFYYYFDNKDQVFDSVLDKFFDHYEEDFRRIIKQGKRNPCRLMYDFFTYMEVETAKFRREYEGNMHRTVRWAIREHTLEIIEPYIRQVVEIQSEYYNVKPALENEVAAMYLTYGVGSSILHEDGARYMSRHKDIQQGTCLIMNMSMEEQPLRIPKELKEENVKGFITLANRMSEFFPGFSLEGLEDELKQRIEKNEAFTYIYQGDIIGGIVFSKGEQSIDFLCVDRSFQRKGLAHRLVETVAAQFEVGSLLSVITFEKGEEKGKAAREFYENLGFKDKETVSLYGERLSKMELTVSERI